MALGCGALEVKAQAGGFYVSGYASVFGLPDQSRDVVAPGAFAKSLAQRRAGGIRMLFQHDPGQPIGTWDVVREDARGLWVEGRLAQGSARAAEIAALMSAGAVDGLSIGFRTLKARRDAASGTRRLIEVDLWEVSIVTFPMQPLARARLSAVPIGKAARGASPLAHEMREAARRLRA
ncbi:MAG: HK97 family phage prohead protease [Hyphomicrobiaceae bacterium]|nr:HK97 family phage prohead protease [Hyphomicrobiaceae bacterium]